MITHYRLKNIIIVILSFTIAISSILLPLLNVHAAVSLPTNYGDNLLLNITPALYECKDGNTRTTTTNSLVSKMNNGDLTDEFFIGLKFADYNGGNVKWYDDGSEVFLDIEFDLGNTCSISAFTMINTSSQELRTGRFKLYLSEFTDNLYDDATALVKDYTNTNKDQVCTIILEEEVTARYAAIRIVNPISNRNGYNTTVTSSNNAVYPRIAEIALFGQKQPSNVSVTTESFTASSNIISELTSNNNLIYNRDYNKVTQVTKGQETTSKAEGKIKTEPKSLTNGIANNSMFFPGAIYFDDNSKPINKAPYKTSENYTTISYFLGGKSNVNSVYVYSHTNTNYINYAYGIYLSNDRSKLFDEESKVYIYENQNNTPLQKFNFTNAIEGSYIGIKFFTSSSPNVSKEQAALETRYIRISQLAVFGSVKEPGVEEKDNNEGSLPQSEEVPNYDKLIATYGQNLAKNISPTVKGFDGSEYKLSSNNHAKLTDQNLSTEYIYAEVKFADFNKGSTVWYDDGTRYVDFTFDFTYKISPKAFLLANHKDEKFRTYQYVIYGSQQNEDLYNDSNKIVDFENTQKFQYNLSVNTNKSQYRYIGLRIIKPYTERSSVSENENLNYIRLLEFSVFGKFSNENENRNNVTIINKEFIDKNDISNYGKSLIAGNDTPKWYYNGSLQGVGKEYFAKSKILTDGDLKKHGDLSKTPTVRTTDGSNYLDVIYTFDKAYDVNRFLFLGISNSYQTLYYTGWYQAFIAEDQDDLFQEENMVFEYKWEKDTSAQMGHVVNFDNYIKRGTCFGIRIRNPVTTATQYVVPRIAEIAVYGTESVIEILPTNLAANMPIEAYWVSGKKAEEISAKNLTVEEIVNLTDGDINTFSTISAKNKKVQILYNLCNDVTLYSIAANCNAKNYKIYLTNDFNTLYKESSLIYSTNTGNTKGISLKGAAAKKKYRYVLFEFSGFGESLVIKELSVIGGDNQLLKHKKVSRTLTGKNVITTSYNYQTQQNKYLNFDDKLRGKLFDTDEKTSIGIYGGKHNEETVDILITFDDIRNIDKFTINFPSMYNDYNPTKVEVYISEKTDAFDTGKINDEPLYTFNGYPNDGVYSYSFRPRLARVMLIRLICGNQEYDGYEDYMCFAINEITLEGTAVVGMQPDESKEELITFKDKKTGIKASVVKFDKNDIYTKAYGLKVTKINATSQWNEALKEFTDLQIIGNNAYKIELVDFNGKALTNLGGRKLKLTVPYNSNEYMFPLLVEANGKNITTLNIDYIEDTVVYYGLEKSKGTYMMAAYQDGDFTNDYETPNMQDEFNAPSSLNTSPDTGDSFNKLILPIIIFFSALNLFFITIVIKKDF